MSCFLTNSSLGKKLVMSISGCFLVLFILFHMAMNLTMLFSWEAYNAICEFLGANWYALAGTVLLAAGVAVHFIYAFILTIDNYRARGKQRYAVTVQEKGVSWASKNMLALGVIVLVGLLLHLTHFWAKMQLPEIMHMSGAHVDAETMANVTNGVYHIQVTFSCIINVVLYLVWLAALWFHLNHGFWSAMQTLGWNNQVWLNRWICISKIYTTIVVLGFAAVVIAFYVQSLMGCGACC